MGVPQGSVLSDTLFALKINSIGKAISPGVECSLYVDDFLIVYRSKYIHIIERNLARSLNMLSHWADSNGFKFSSSKTACIHFYRLRSACPNPELMLNGTLIPSTHSLPRRVCEGAKPSACCCSHLLGSRAADLLTSL